MLRIHTSHRTEALLDAFVRNVATERENPFTPVQVVTPNKNVETYLRLGVAERCGIAANIEMIFLRKFLGRLAVQAVPDAEVAEVALVEGHLLALLHDDALLARPALARVKGYLAAAGNDRDAVDRRRCQLAAQLAQLFDEYAASRPELLAAWSKSKAEAAVTSEPELETWQHALWLSIFGPDGRLAARTKQTGIRSLPLAQLWDEAMRAKPPPFAGQTSHMFGVSYVATAYHRMLELLAAASEVHVYTLNPCREDERDLVAPPGASPDDPFALACEPNAALAQWARPGRENLRLLARLEGATVDGEFPEGKPATLLGRLQDDIMARRAAGAGAQELDGSLAILPCPSPRRELEIVAAEIWGLARRDPTLRLCDVAVIVPEAKKDLYLAQLPAVFAESRELPHSVADLPAASGHRAAEAIAMLVRLPFAGFSRKALLPLLTHPCLMARFPGATPEAWGLLTAQLGIVRGADRGDFAGTYLERDLFTWDQGLRRLALGAFADMAEPSIAAPVAFAADRYLPGPAIEDRNQAALGFGLLARSLIADARFALDKPRPIAEWLDFLRAMIESYLVLFNDDHDGQAVKGRFLAALADVPDRCLGDLPVSYRVAATFAERALEGVAWNRGHYLAEGVTVASFVPMRAIPFRAIFVLGLGQGDFPSAGGRHELDLRKSARRAGDVDRRDQDRYMFLETLLSAREHLVLSYVARDEITGDELPASPVLLELRAMLEQGYLGTEALARLYGDEKELRPTLRRFDDTADRREVLPAAEAEYRARELGKLVPKEAHGALSVRERVAALPGPTAAKVAHVLGLRAIPGDKPDETAASITIRLSALRRFLEEPLQGSARFRLGMADDDEDDGADIEDEPFDMEKRLLSALLRGSMTDAILAAGGRPALDDLKKIHEDRAYLRELGGDLPSGIFRAPSASFEDSVLAGWHEKLPEVLGTNPARCRTIRFTPNIEVQDSKRERDANVEHRPAPSFTVSLPGRKIDVTLVGETRLWVAGADGGESALSFTLRGKLGDKVPAKEELGAFLDYVTLTAAGGEPSRPGARSALFHAADGTPDLRLRALGKLDRETARDYLANLCADLLTGAPAADGSATSVHPYLLPHEAVFKSQESKKAVGDEIDSLCASYDGDHGRFSTVYGPVPAAIERFQAPSEENARRMVEARFGLFFRTLGSKESA